jgi:Mg2+/citrate symporter
MLALLGLTTVVVLLAVILTKRMSPLIALIVIPVAASLAGGFGLDTSRFIVDGLKSLAPSVGDHQKFAIPFLFTASVVMTIACVPLGVFPL